MRLYFHLIEYLSIAEKALNTSVNNFLKDSHATHGVSSDSTEDNTWPPQRETLNATHFRLTQNDALHSYYRRTGAALGFDRAPSAAMGL